MSHRLMAFTISVRCEPVESEPRCMSSQNWIKCWTSFSISNRKLGPGGPDDQGCAGEGASLAIFFEDGPVVYMANAFDSFLWGD